MEFTHYAFAIEDYTLIVQIFFFLCRKQVNYEAFIKKWLYLAYDYFVISESKHSTLVYG